MSDPVWGELPASRSPNLFYIQNRGYCGNCLSWWRIGGHGYTLNLDEAWRVPKEQAEAIVRNRPGLDKAWPVEVIDESAHRHVNCETLRSKGMAA